MQKRIVCDSVGTHVRGIHSVREVCGVHHTLTLLAPLTHGDKTHKVPDICLQARRTKRVLNRAESASKDV